MIIFHEGLPRSGKSYEAMVYRMVPALAKGREVVAYIEGLDHEKIAPLANITVDRCKELLFALTREQMDNVLPHVRDNALHIFDEAQNFWGNREKLSKAFTQFVTEHGHRGMDIVLMGQDRRDVHSLWRRRIEIVQAFVKLSGLGTDKTYSVTTWKHQGGEVYIKVGTQVHRYDQKYFGTYASHTGEDINTANYKDGRAMVLNHAGIKFGVPIVLVLAVWGGFTAWKFFHPDASPRPGGSTLMTATTPGVAAPAAARPASSPPPADLRSPAERRLAELSTRSRIRLAGIISTPKRVTGLVEWVDGNAHVSERLSFDALRDLGVAIIMSEGAVRLALGNWSELATSWPMEAEGRVSQARLERMKPEKETTSTEGGGLIIIGPAKVQPATEDQHEPVTPVVRAGRRPAA